eukprot:s1703_g10.t1
MVNALFPLAWEAAVAEQKSMTPGALHAALGRICKPKPGSGKLEEQFKKHVEHLQKKSRRHDKYDGTKEYWVDVETTGSFENEAEETITDRTSVEGQGSTMDLGLTAPVPAACGDPEGGCGGDDSSEEDDEGGADGAASSISKRRTTPAVDNIGTVVSNLLKTQSKLEGLKAKLSSRALMEEIKLKKTVLRSARSSTDAPSGSKPVAKAKAKAKGKAKSKPKRRSTETENADADGDDSEKPRRKTRKTQK